MRISDWSSDVCSSDPMVAASIREGEAAPLAVAVSRTVALGPFTTMLRELSHAFPGLQLQLRRGTGAEVTEYLKQGTAELAIAGPLDEPWSRLDAFPLFEEPFQDRKSVVLGKSVSVRLYLGGRRRIKKKKN